MVMKIIQIYQEARFCFWYFNYRMTELQIEIKGSTRLNINFMVMENKKDMKSWNPKSLKSSK